MKFKKALRTLTNHRGGQAALAVRLDVNRSTVSRWVSRETRPNKVTRGAIKFLAQSGLTQDSPI